MGPSIMSYVRFSSWPVLGLRVLSLEFFIAFETTRKKKKGSIQVQLYNFVKNTPLFLGSITEARTVIGANVATFAFVDDGTFC